MAGSDRIARSVEGVPAKANLGDVTAANLIGIAPRRADNLGRESLAVQFFRALSFGSVGEREDLDPKRLPLPGSTTG